MISTSEKSNTSPLMTKVKNNFFDEAMEISESENERDNEEESEQIDESRYESHIRGDSPPSAKIMISEDEYEEEYQHDKQEDVGHGLQHDMKRILDFVTRYSPQEQDLNTNLKPFIPELIPCIGDIDAFIKIPRPDHQDDELGLSFVDEPCAIQSDPSVLDLHLRKQAKQSQIVPQKVRSVDSAVLYSDKRPIDQWIFSTKELHSQKTVQQVKQNLVCDVEPLMQTWPSEIEELMKSNHVLPTPEIELTLDQYTRLIMAILDVPVKEKGLIQACHAVFTLYQEFQNSDHFKAMNRV